MQLRIRPMVRPDCISANGRTFIYIEITLRGKLLRKRTYISLQNKKNFNQKRWAIKPTEPDHRHKQALLGKLLAKVELQALQLMDRNIPLSHEALFAAMEPAKTELFITYAEQVINQRPTTEHRKTVMLHYVKQFEAYKPGCYLVDINAPTLEAFKQHLVANYAHNSVKNILGGLRVIVLAAMRDNLLHNNPFNVVKVGAYKPKQVFLSFSDLQRMESMRSRLDAPQLKVLDRFLFCCYTGLRYSDVNTLYYENLHHCTHGYYLKKIQVKTNEQVIVPLNQYAEKLVNVTQTSGVVFEPITNQYNNRVLKQIGQLMRLPFTLTTHVARHTFVSVSLELGADKSIAGKIAGHKQSSTTDGYAHFNLSTLFSLAAHWNNNPLRPQRGNG